jgi:diacylglycerol kinase (ATP)
MQNREASVSAFKSKSGIKRIYTAFFYSIAGLKAAWENENAFRQELLLSICGTFIAFLLPVSIFERLILIAVFMLLLIVELINSAIEAIVDRISLEHHILSKNAKDFGSAAVFLTFLLAIVTWLVIIFQLI